MQERKMDQAAHFTVYIQLCETRAAGRSAQGTNLRSVMIPAKPRLWAWAEVLWTLHGFLHLSALPIHDDLPTALFLETIRSVRRPCACTRLPFSSDHERLQLFQPRLVAGRGAWKGWDDSSATASPTQNPEQVSRERVTNALYMTHHLQQTTVISHRRSLRAICSKDQGQCCLRGHGGHHSST